MAFKRCDSVLQLTPIPDEDHDFIKTSPCRSPAGIDYDFARTALYTPQAGANVDSVNAAPPPPLAEADYDLAEITVHMSWSHADLKESCSPVANIIDAPRQVRLKRYDHKQTTSKRRKLSFEDCVLRICEVRAVELGLSMSMFPIAIRSLSCHNFSFKYLELALDLELFRLATTGEISNICRPLELEGMLISMHNEMHEESYILPLFAATSSQPLRRLPVDYREIDTLRESDFIIKHSQLLPG